MPESESNKNDRLRELAANIDCFHFTPYHAVVRYAAVHLVIEMFIFEWVTFLLLLIMLCVKFCCAAGDGAGAWLSNGTIIKAVTEFEFDKAIVIVSGVTLMFGNYFF